MVEESREQTADSTPRRTGIAPIAIGVILALIGAVGAVAVLRVDSWGENGNRLPDRFEFDVADVTAVDPALVTYSEVGQVPLAMAKVEAIATGVEGQFLVAGDRSVRTFRSDGTAGPAIPLSGEPKCLAVAGADHRFPGRLYVGFDSQVEAFDAEGTSLSSWSQGLDDRSLLTSLAVFEDSIFAADAGNRVVLRWDLEGRLIETIGRADPENNVLGFIIPSPHFDIAIPADGVLRVANPGVRRIEAYTLDGDLLGHWGEASSQIEGFFGCCNPSNFAMLADGGFVTAEKGIPRIKVYSAQGQFQSVVATPQTLVPGLTIGQEIRDDHAVGVFDVAVDTSGRVLVLDPNKRQVRIFERKDRGGSNDAG